MTEKALRLRRRLLQLHFEAKVGHLGGNLSCIDMMSTLFERMDWSKDRFILSKGHSAGALYIALWNAGRMTEAELKQFHQDNTMVGGHPSAHFKPEIPFFTGSLGHGFGLGCGLALAKKLKNESGHVYVLMSDGEWQEGSNWEALNFALHHQLDNLTILTDFNQIQGFGRLRETMSMHNLPDRVRAQGAWTSTTSGHDADAIGRALDSNTGQFRALFFETLKGYGITFMQDQVDWHYWTMNDEQFQKAISEIDLLIAKGAP